MDAKVVVLVAMMSVSSVMALLLPETDSIGPQTPRRFQACGAQDVDPTGNLTSVEEWSMHASEQPLNCGCVARGVGVGQTRSQTLSFPSS